MTITTRLGAISVFLQDLSLLMSLSLCSDVAELSIEVKDNQLVLTNASLLTKIQNDFPLDTQQIYYLPAARFGIYFWKFNIALQAITNKLNKVKKNTMCMKYGDDHYKLRSHSKFCDVTALGQVGFRLCFGQIIIYIDPYLSNSVQQLDNDAVRMMPIPIAPDEVQDADYVFITHEHADHCDAQTLLPLSKASPNCQFICPNSVSLIDWGISENRIMRATPANKLKFLTTLFSRKARTVSPIQLKDLTVHIVPSAHPSIEVDATGDWRYVGYVFEWQGKRLYHAGDTGVAQEIIDRLQEIGKIDVAFLPVNEQNFYRAKRGIIGNMSIREAFQMAIDIGVETLVPTHWDMFASNQVYREEIELLYQKMNPPFRLSIYPTQV
jgi:L-ascorbate metabolism protein UlaG (beta-lactamase superfamily)